MPPGVVCHAAGGAEAPPRRTCSSSPPRPRAPAPGGAAPREAHRCLPGEGLRPLSARAGLRLEGALPERAAPQRLRSLRDGGSREPRNSSSDFYRSLRPRNVSVPASGVTLGGGCASPRLSLGSGFGPVPGGSDKTGYFLEKSAGSPEPKSMCACTDKGIHRGGVVDYKASGRDFLIRVLGCPPFGAVSEGSPRVHPIPPEAQVQGLPLWVGKRGRWRGVRMLRIRRRVRPEPGRNPSVIWRVRQNVILLSLFA